MKKKLRAKRKITHKIATIKDHFIPGCAHNNLICHKMAHSDVQTTNEMNGEKINFVAFNLISIRHDGQLRIENCRDVGKKVLA